MPNVVATNGFGNASAVVGGPYLDNHAPCLSLLNNMPSAFNYTAPVTTINANDISGVATATNEPQFSTQYVYNSVLVNRDQGRLV